MIVEGINTPQNESVSEQPELDREGLPAREKSPRTQVHSRIGAASPLVEVIFRHSRALTGYLFRRGRDEQSQGKVVAEGQVVPRTFVKVGQVVNSALKSGDDRSLSLGTAMSKFFRLPPEDYKNN